ncbi:transcription termination factor MTERF15, mitochondrial [Mercurialis annua]|uniref:transcription termination factor MTERF15, mitochondrial n=1 Tax=Mercurialis annua TaxID=3986 RepID=UPI00216082B6|nr:transcription termination factor MTERF15, mitochondrial [Mercurialis annua]
MYSKFATFPFCLKKKDLKFPTMASKTLIFRTKFIRFLSTNPNFPSQSQYRKQISLANIFQRYGFSSSQLHSFISTNHFLLNSNLQDIEKSLGLLLSFKIPQKSLISLISECPGVLEFDFLKKWELGFSKFGDLSVSPFLIKGVLGHSKRFQIDPDGFYKSVNVLKGLGFSEGTVRRVLEEFPGVITMRGSEIHSKIEFLMRIGFGRDEVDWIFNSYPVGLGYGIKNRLMPLIDEFMNSGFSREVIKEEIARQPRILGLELGEFSRCLELLKSLKCREPIKLKILSDGAFRAAFEVKLRVDCLCKHGLTRREALKVLAREPRVIIYEIEDIEKKIEFLLNTMKMNVCCVFEVPEYLGVSLEKQIVPRYNVIEYLRARGGLGDEVSLKGMIKLSRLKFYNLNVKPYPECEKMFGRFSGKEQVKRQHPVGLWKSFKPQMHTCSKQDERNMKSFMEGLT